MYPIKQLPIVEILDTRYYSPNTTILNKIRECYNDNNYTLINGICHENQHLIHERGLVYNTTYLQVSIEVRIHFIIANAYPIHLVNSEL